jgi:hypothetical protein
MPRSRGLTKTGGRKKGTPNKRTQEVTELLDSLGCNPIEGMVKIAEDSGVDISIRSRMYAELATYIFPKRKAMSVDLSIETESYEQRIKRLRADIEE